MLCTSCLAIVRACYTMENGPNDKNGKKMGKPWKICPDRKWGKNGQKIPKKWKIGPIFHFLVFFGHFFPIFDRGKFSTFFPFFSHFCRSARFPLCSRPARLQILSTDGSGRFYRIPEKSPKSSTGKMNRACELKDQTLKKITWWTFRIFFIFFVSGEGRGRPRRREEGGRFLY